MKIIINQIGSEIFMAMIILNIKAMVTKVPSFKEILDETKPYLKDLKNNLKKIDTCKIQLRILINFMSSNDTNDEHVMYFKKSDNIDRNHNY